MGSLISMLTKCSKKIKRISKEVQDVIEVASTDIRDSVIVI